MTVMTPNKNRSIALFVTELLVLLLVASLFYIYYYNTVAGRRYAAERLRDQIADARELNAELKNELYEATDPTRLEELATARNLVLEEAPHYMSMNQWVSDSSF
ncbi:hypothetical protein A2110_01100 [Candidatus Jorgensenbacteria bacterium GWA1_54_12]|uniref:Cell division protein FtsL n=1 Tax=Candidatus Jorgensenbacteria bacterium GWA1_54_12 TaxID=1798468 RepID=A0A1F6BIM3_9BACT|nr:MAG: hypothetical protein A2110_01100 [Candidatus Jorgensenbacteria bacterium GWA1_54_12]